MNAGRFWTKVDKTSECWVWTAARHRLGYGHFWLDGKMRFAHRVAWELTRGEIPSGLSLDHLCRNRACVRPDHLEPVTHRQNVMRGVGPTAVNATKSECVNGHGLSGENLIVRPNGTRGCLACLLEQNRDYRARLASEREGRYSCPACGWRFDTPKGVAAHKGRRHRGEPPLPGREAA